MTTDTPPTAGDADLLGRLRAADPAASLPPLEPRRVDALLEAAMTTTRTDPRPIAQTDELARRRRRRMPLLGAVAASAALLGGAVAATNLLGSTPAPARSVAVAPTKVAKPLALTVPKVDAASAMCMRLSADMIRGAQFAFDGEVTAVTGGVATLSVTTWYHGGAGATTVTVTQPEEVMTALVGAPRFEVGGRYLIAGGDGQIGLCGVSDAWSPALAGFYTEAFGG